MNQTFTATSFLFTYGRLWLLSFSLGAPYPLDVCKQVYRYSFQNSNAPPINTISSFSLLADITTATNHSNSISSGTSATQMHMPHLTLHAGNKTTFPLGKTAVVCEAALPSQQENLTSTPPYLLPRPIKAAALIILLRHSSMPSSDTTSIPFAVITHVQHTTVFSLLSPLWPSQEGPASFHLHLFSGTIHLL